MKSPILPTSVYVLACADRIKIGIAANVKARVVDLQMHCPLPIEIAGAREFPSRDNARMVERSLHARFGASRLHGEWFAMTAAEALAALAQAEELPAPVVIPGRLQSRQEPLTQQPERPVRAASAPAIADRDGPTWDQYEAMDDATWSDFMRPVAATLNFEDPDPAATADRLEAGLRVKYPQYFGRLTPRLTGIGGGKVENGRRRVRESL